MTILDAMHDPALGTLRVIAADRRQARTVMRYIAGEHGFLEDVPMLRQMVVRRTKESIKNRPK